VTDAGHAPPPEGRLGSRYWRLWTAGTISNLGDGANAAALPLLVASVTRDPRLVAGISVFFTLPWLLFALPAGALVDRLDRKKVMWRVNLVRAVLVGAVATMAATGTTSVWALYGVVLAIGFCETMFDNAAQAMVPSVVAPDLLEKANGRQYAGEVVMNTFAGPPVGGLLFAVAVSLPFWLDAGSFVVSAALIATLAGSYRPRATAARDPAGERRTLRADIAEGIRWLRGHRLLRTLAVLLGLANGASAMANATFVLLAIEELGASEQTFGLLLAAGGVGSVVGGLVGERVVARVGAGGTLFAAALLTGVVIPVAIGSSSEWVLAGALFSVQGFFIVLWNVVTVSLRQQLIPAQLFGRVNSVYRFLGLGMMPVGAVAGGLIAGAYGLRAPWYVSAAIFGAAMAVAAAMAGFTPRAIDRARAEALSDQLRDEAVGS
jgi:MFS family permease